MNVLYQSLPSVPQFPSLRYRVNSSLAGGSIQRRMESSTEADTEADRDRHRQTVIRWSLSETDELMQCGASPRTGERWSIDIRRIADKRMSSHVTPYISHNPPRATAPLWRHRLTSRRRLQLDRNRIFVEVRAFQARYFKRLSFWVPLWPLIPANAVRRSKVYRNSTIDNTSWKIGNCDISDRRPLSEDIKGIPNSINQSISQFIVIWQLEGWTAQSDN